MRFWILLAACCVSVAWSRDVALNLAAAPKDLDAPACVTWDAAGTERVATAEELAGVLQGERTAWAGAAVTEGFTHAPFRVALQQPTAIGAVLSDAVALSALKPDAPYPGDPADPDHWLPLPRREAGGSPWLYTAPPGLRTRALLATVSTRPDRPSHRLNTLMPIAERVHSITPWARANAKTEYTLYPSMGPPHLFAAADILKGGAWRNAGTNRDGFNTSPPISDLHPTWMVLSFAETRDVVAICTSTNGWSQIQLHSYTGPDGINPVVATEKEWREIPGLTVKSERDGVTLIRLPQAVHTRGLRITILNVDPRDPQVAAMTGLQILEPLGDAPLPDAPDVAGDRPRFAIPYTLQDAGYFGLVINRPDGSRVRTLIQNTWRGPGPGSEAWDLKDDHGMFVPPGDYRFSAIWLPELTLRYETTAYPNVSSLFPDRAAWLNGMNDPHGWMADHSAPLRAAASGDRLWFGAPVAESGVSLVETELSGRKMWATHSFAAFTGVHQLAVDSSTIYAAAPMRNAVKYIDVDPNSEGIWAIDRTTHAETQLAILEPTNQRLRGLVGMAAHAGKLYMAIRAESRWLVSAAKAADVDLTASQPRYKPKREARKAHEVVPDPQSDFQRLFRLTGVPPGIGGDGFLTQLESTRGPSNRQFIVLAFQKPVALGSAVLPLPQGVDYRVELSILKPDGAWPPLPEDSSQWQKLESQPTRPWDVVAFPEGARTRALRIAFLKGDDDMFAAVMDGEADGPDALLAGGGGGGISWNGLLDGVTLLRRRYANVAGAATVHVSSGRIAADGTWTAERDRPLTETDPAIYALEWAAPQNLRGLALKEVDGETTRVDVYTGAPGAKLDIRDDSQWREVGSYTQSRRNWRLGTDANNNRARYLDGYVDFGEQIETRAVRLRVVKQWTDNGDRGLYGGREDRGDKSALDTTRAVIYGVAALRYLGGEEPADPLQTERVEVYDAKAKTIVAETHVPRLRDLAVDRAGQVYVISQTQVLRVDPATHTTQVVIDADLQDPRTLTLDADGSIYVFDQAPARQNIRVYGPDGAFQREIGEAGGYRVGPWNPMRLHAISSIAATDDGHIWAVSNYYPIKRVSQFTRDGRFVKDIFGPTRYGGNGVLDPWDKNRIYVNNMQYRIDWETGKVEAETLLWLGDHIPEQPIRLDGREYMVTRFEVHGPYQGCGVVYLRDGDSLRRVAAMGVAAEFEPLKDPAVVAAMGNITLPGKAFLWTDDNGNGQVDGAEVRIVAEGIDRLRPTVFSRDLGLQMGSMRFTVTGFRDDGTPIYAARQTPARGSSAYAMETGGWIHFHDTGITRQGSDGRELWTLPGEPPGVHGLYKAKPYFDGQLVALFSYIGEESVPAGDLGHIVVMHSNTGGWHIITDDGLYAGDILRNYRRGGAEFWRFPEHERGMNLHHLTAGQEHFRGYFTRSFSDDRFYIVAGHNHASVVEVQGLEQARRQQGQITVAAADITAAQQWERDREQEAVYARAPVYDCYRASDSIQIDAQADDWRESGVASWELERGPSAYFRMVYDDTHLYLLYQMTGYGRLANSADDIRRAFKTGAAVDLQIGVDPAAPHDRQAPVPGDQRLLITQVDGKPRAVLYRAVVPGTAPADRWVVSSPVQDVKFDQVVELADVTIKTDYDPETGTSVVEARIPLAALGLTPQPDLRLRFDWGLLEGTPQGNAVTQRIYWANQATSIISDAPSEARLHPNLWGIVRFHGKLKSALNKTLDANPLLEPAPNEKPASIDALEDLF